MRLSARPLVDVSGVNNFRPATTWSWTESDPLYLYFQLVDSSLDLSSEGFQPPGRRYAAASGATLTCTFVSLDSDKVVSRAATQPYSEDKSIWRVQILATDAIRGTVGMQLALVEGSNTIRGLLQPAACVQSRYLTR